MAVVGQFLGFVRRLSEKFWHVLRERQRAFQRRNRKRIFRQHFLESLEPRRVMAAGPEGSRLSSLIGPIGFTDYQPPESYQASIDPGNGTTPIVFTVYPTSVELTEYGTGDDGSPLYYDATIGLEIPSDIVYTDNGDFQLIVTLTGSDGRTFTSSQSITITNLEPFVKASVATPRVNRGQTTTIAFSAIDPGADTISSWSIDWGNGYTQTVPGTDRSATYRYPDVGNFNITVRPTDEDGTHRKTPVFLNSGFGSNGVVETNFGPNTSFSTLAIAPNGALVTGGTRYVGVERDDSWDFLLSKYAPNGSLDSNFGVSGIVTTGMELDPTGGYPTDDYTNKVVVQSNGMILMLGTRNGSPTLLRYTSDGTLDTSFGVDGQVSIASLNLPRSFYPTLLTVQSDGGILLGERYFYNDSGNSDFSLVRLDSNGVTDEFFGHNGVVTTDVSGGEDYLDSITVQSDGKILALGTSYDANSGYASIGLVRYNNDGSLDTTFNTIGWISFDFDPSASYSHNYGKQVLVQNDEKIVVVGEASSSNLGIGMARFLPDGLPDDTFGINGRVTANYATGDYESLGGIWVSGAALQTDGKIVVTGTSVSGSQPLLVRFSANGTPESDAPFLLGQPSHWLIGVAARQDGDVNVALHGINPSNGDYSTSILRVRSSSSVTVFNTAPVLDNTGATRLTMITEDQLTNPGNSVAEIIASAGGDRVTDVDIVPAGNTVVARQLFYNRSTSSVFGNGTGNPINAIASNKRALLPGQAAQFANYTNVATGITGLLVDISGPVAGLTASDFQFATWDGKPDGSFATLPVSITPLISVIANGGGPGISRVKIEFPDNSIRNTWLRVTVLATSNTGLRVDDNFYFGNAVGDVNGADGSGMVSTTGTDTSLLLTNQSAAVNSAGIASIFDLNKDGRVNGLDTNVMLSNQSNDVIRLITAAPAVPSNLAREGIAITATTNGNGRWQYSVDSGASWNDVGAVSDTSSLLLRATNYLRFVPDGKNGASPDVTFRAWDQTSGTAGSKVSMSTTGGTTAFSTATEIASITVTSVNDTPVLDNTGTMSIPRIQSDATSNIGATVASIIASAGGDRITDVDAGALEGIAITEVQPTAFGKWQFLLDGGITWTDVGAVSISSSLLLRDSDRIRFLSTVTSSGGTSIFSFKAWDRTIGSPGSKVSTATNGGTSAFSTANETASITVNSVYNPPVAYRSFFSVLENSTTSLLPIYFNSSARDSSADGFTRSLIIKTLPTNGILTHRDGNLVVPGTVIDTTAYRYTDLLAGDYNLIGSILNYTSFDYFQYSGPRRDTFSFSVAENGVESNIASMNIGIAPSRNYLFNDDYEVYRGSPLVADKFFGLLNNDEIVEDQGTFSVVIDKQPTRGSINLNPDGTFVYTLFPQFIDTGIGNYDYFSYKLVGSSGQRLAGGADVRIQERYSDLTLVVPQSGSILVDRASRRQNSYFPYAAEVGANIVCDPQAPIGQNGCVFSDYTTFSEYNLQNVLPGFVSAHLDLSPNYGFTWTYDPDWRENGPDSTAYNKVDDPYSYSYYPYWRPAHTIGSYVFSGDSQQAIDSYYSQLIGIGPAYVEYAGSTEYRTGQRGTFEIPLYDDTLRDLKAAIKSGTNRVTVALEERNPIQSTQFFRDPYIIFNYENVVVDDGVYGTDRVQIVAGDQPSIVSANSFGLRHRFSGIERDASRVFLNSLPRQGFLTLDGVRVVSPVSVPAGSIQSGGLVYHPTSYHQGGPVDSFDFTLVDYNSNETNPDVRGSVTLVANSIPKNPYIDFLNDAVIRENGQFSTTIKLSSFDSQFDSLVLSATSNNPSLLPASGIMISGTGRDRELTLVPVSNRGGRADVSITVTDQAGRSHVRTFSLDVWPLNHTRDDGPINVRHTSITKGIDVLGNDDLFLGSNVRLIVDSMPDLGEIRVAPNRTLDFIPKSGAMGLTQFTYHLTDGVSNSETATVTLNIINNAPIAVSDQYTSVTHSRSKVLDVLSNDTDAQGDVLRIILDQLPTHGSVEIGADGKLVYTPDRFYVGADSLRYHLHDGVAASNSVDVQLHVVNHAPVANDFDVLVPRSNSVGQQLTSVASDTDRDYLTIRIKQQPTDGRVTIHDHGDILYERWSTVLSTAWADSFTYTLFDGLVESNEATVTFSLRNSLPIAWPDSYTTQSNRNVFQNVIANDRDPDGDKLRASIRSGAGPLNAKEFRFDEDGTFVYVPMDGFEGVDTFVYDLFDFASVPNGQTVTIDVNNSVPIAVDIGLQAEQDKTLSSDLKHYQTSLSGKTVTYRSVTEPTNGILSMGSDGNVTYLPNKGFYGVDSFTYTVNDGRKTSSPKTATITVAKSVGGPVGGPIGGSIPFIITNSATFYAISNYAIVSNTYSLLNLVSDNRPNKTLPLVVSLYGNSFNGNQVHGGWVEISPNGTFTFTPQGNFVGRAVFQYQVTDGNTSSLPANIEVFVDRPRAVNDQFWLNETKTELSGTVVSNDYNIKTIFLSNSYRTVQHQWDDVEFQLVEDQSLILGAESFTLNADGSFVYKRKPDFVGQDYFSYQIVSKNGWVLSDPARAVIAVAPNSPPTMTSIQIHVQSNGTSAKLKPATDPDGDRLSFEFRDTTRLTDNLDGTLTYRSQNGFLGLDSAMVRAFDGKAYSPWTQLIFEVSNQAPEVATRPISVHHGKTVDFDLVRHAFDADRDALTFRIITPPVNGGLTNLGGNSYRYVSNFGQVGNDYIQFEVSDGIATTTGTLTVTSTNTAPQANWTRSNGPDKIDEYWVSPNEVLVADNKFGFAKVVEGARKGDVIHFNDPVYTGKITLLDYLRLGSPSDVQELIRTNELRDQRKTLIYNDFDADEDRLKVVLHSTVQYGQLVVLEDGSFVYTPDPLHLGQQSFTYRVFDGVEYSQPATVLIHVQNDAPTSKDISITTGRHGRFGKKADDTALSLTGNSRDPEGATLTYSVASVPTKGTVTINSDGSYQYKNTDGLVGVDSFSYRSFDGTSYSRTATVAVEVKNDKPVAKSDSYDAIRDFNKGGLFDSVYSVIGDLPATDPDKDKLTLDYRSGPFHGTFSIDTDGEFVYVPNSGFVGTDTVVYRVTDGILSSNYAELKFNVRQSAPRAVDDVFSTTSFINDVLNVNFDRSVLRNDTDSESQALRAILWSGPAQGQGILAFNPNGTFQYTPPQGFVGKTEFSYIVTDGVTKSLPATVRIDVQLAKFAVQASPINVDLNNQSTIGGIARFDYPEGISHDPQSIVQLTWNTNESASGAIRATGLPAGQPQWEIVPSNLIFRKLGKQIVSVKIIDSLQRVSTTKVEFQVNAAAPVLVASTVNVTTDVETSIKLATFRDLQNLATSSYRVSVDWGDSVVSDGLVTRTSFGNFEVSGTHRYQTSGSKSITIQLISADGVRSSLAIVGNVTKQLVLQGDQIAVTSPSSRNFNGKISSFTSNLPANEMAKLSPFVYWGDGTSSKGEIVSLGNGRYELHGSHLYASFGTYPIVITLSDPNDDLDAYTSIASNPSVVAFTQDLEGLKHESSQPRTIVQFYGNLRGNTAARYSVGINWNDSRNPVEQDNLVTSGGGWYEVQEPLGYAEGTFSPTVSIHQIDGDAVTTEASLSSTTSIARIDFQQMPSIVIASTDESVALARFTTSLPAISLSDLSAEVSWSDGTQSSGKIKPVAGSAGVLEVFSERAIQPGSQLVATVRIRSIATISTSPQSGTLLNSLAVGRSAARSSGGDSSTSGSTSQGVVGGNGTDYLPIRDVSTASCPNEFKLFIDKENYEVDSDDDDLDDVKVKQKFGGAFGRFVQVNDGDANHNNVVDSSDNLNGVSQLVGSTVPLTLSFVNQPQPPNTTPSDVEIRFEPWDESYLRIWQYKGGTYTKLTSGGTYTPADLGIPNTGGSTTLYIEGLKASQSRGDQIIHGTFYPLGSGAPLDAEVKVTIGDVNLVVDALKEIWEDSPTEPGAIILKNSNFTKQKADTTGQQEQGLTKFVPDYLAKNFGFATLIDPKYDIEFTFGKIQISQWMVQSTDVKLTFDETKMVVWTTGNWGGLTPSSSPGFYTIPTGKKLRPTTEDLYLWVEGIEETPSSANFVITAAAFDRIDRDPYGHDDVKYVVADVNVAVDGDRDGKIDFDNSFDQQLTFWLNNDQEKTDDRGDEIDVLDSEITNPDNSDNYIRSVRDLEDFATMNFFVSPSLRELTRPGSPLRTAVTFEAELENAASSELRLFKSVSTSDDALSHVRDQGIANSQVNDENYRKFKISAIAQSINLRMPEDSDGVLRYLFEALGNISRGDDSAVLNPTLLVRTKVHYPGGREISFERRVKIELRDIKAFYTRREIQYLVGGNDFRTVTGFPHFPDSVVTGTSRTLATPFLSGDEKVVLVHGWDMSPEWKAAFAQTAVKRLYWQGFRGETITFDWPTFTQREVPHIGPEMIAGTYNASEFQALRSGRSLMNYLSSLPTGSTHLLAHSMGNVVAAEAFRQWSGQSSSSLVRNYVALEAAISAGAYGVTTSTAASAFVVDTGPLTNGWVSAPFDPLIQGPSTDLFQNYMIGTTSAASNWINFYNPDDSATNNAWRLNNSVKLISNRYSPGFYWDDFIGARHFIPTTGASLPSPDFWNRRYVYDNGTLYRLDYPDLNPLNFIEGYNTSYVMNNTSYEAIAFLGVSSVATVGNTPMSIFGWTDVDIRSMLNGTPTNKFSTHSFQFYHDAAKTSAFWKRLRDSTRFETTRP